MPRKRKPLTHDQDYKKQSLRMPRALIARLEQAMGLTHSTFTDLVCRILDENVDRYTAQGEHASVHLELTKKMQEAIAAATDLSGLSPKALVQLILSDHVADYLESNRARRAQLETKLRETPES